MQRASLWLEGTWSLEELKEVLVEFTELWEDWGETRLEMSSGPKKAGPSRIVCFISSVLGRLGASAVAR